MAAIQVDVAWGPDGTELIITPEAVTLRDGDWVWWVFPSDLQEKNQFAMIFFDIRFGPFHMLRSLDYRQVIGKGNIGAVDETPYTYTAMILTPGDPHAVARGIRKGTVVNSAGTKVNTAPDIAVIYEPGGLTVDPDPVGLNTGDTATWNIDGLPAGAFADFYFTDPSLQSVSGPFTSFFACAAGEAGIQASGTNFDLGNKKSVDYLIEIRDADGNLLAKHEPGIDNLGPPIPG